MPIYVYAYTSALLGGYLLYLVVMALLPYALPKRVSEQSKKEVDDILKEPEYSSDRVMLLDESTKAFLHRISLFRLAEHQLEIVYHSVHDGDTTDFFFAEVLKAADRGVKVRLLLDAKTGGLNHGDRGAIALALAHHPNIQYKTYNRLTFFSPWKWNTLLHDKFIISDNKLLITGGRNLGDKYFPPPKYDGPVTRDCDVLILNTDHQDLSNKKSVIYKFLIYMESLWNQPESRFRYRILVPRKARKAEVKHQALLKKAEEVEKNFLPYNILYNLEYYHALALPTKGIKLLTNPLTTIKKQPTIGYGLAQLAYKAEKSLTIQTPYATANSSLLKVFKNISAKQIPFTMVTNSLSSSPNFPAFSNYRSRRRRFLNTGVKIFEYQSNDDSIHAKSILFDDELSAVGTYNLDDRSIFIDTESMVIISSREFNQQLQEEMDKWVDRSLEVGANNRYTKNDHVEYLKPSFSKTLLMWVVSVFTRLFQFLI